MFVHPSRTLPCLLLASLLSSPAAASITPAARKVVDAYVVATGGRAAFQAERTLRVKGTIAAFGSKGDFESWCEDPNRTWTSIHFGRLEQQTGFDGSNAWRVDLATARASLLEGADRDVTIGDAYFQNELWAKPDQGGGRVAMGGRAYSDDGVQQALEITPPSGETRRLWFHQKSGLLVRAVSRRNGREWSERFTDYRRLAGRLRAMTIESGEAHAPRSQRVQVDSVWANLPGDSTRFLAPREAIGELRRDSSPKPHGVVAGSR